MRLLVTRTGADLDRTMATVGEMGHHPVACPVADIRYVADALPQGRSWNGLILTSRHAVAALVAAGAVDRLRHLPVATVGAATAAAARTAGFSSVKEGGGTAEAMIARIVREKWHGPMLYVSGAVIATDPAPALARNGIEVERVVAYEAVARDDLLPEAVAAIGNGEAEGGVFFSARTVRIFADLVRDAGLDGWMAGATAFCLSSKVAAAASSAGFGDISMAPAPTEEAMVDLLREAL